MARYAVELGKIQLRSDTPITTEERAEAIKLMQETARETLADRGPDGLTIAFVPAP